MDNPRRNPVYIRALSLIISLVLYFLLIYMESARPNSSSKMCGVVGGNFSGMSFYGNTTL